jgi:hypothetical protein
VLLKTPDFAAATGLLRERGIITDSTEGKYIVLKEGQTTTETTKALVEAGIAVEGIWQQDQTLEDFYLSLIKAAPPKNN